MKNNGAYVAQKMDFKHSLKRVFKNDTSNVQMRAAS